MWKEGALGKVAVGSSGLPWLTSPTVPEVEVEWAFVVVQRAECEMLVLEKDFQLKENIWGEGSMGERGGHM